MIQQHVLLLDLKDDPASIAAYEEWHRKVWPGILKNIHEGGIEDMQIFRAGNRLVMLMHTNKQFDFTAKSIADANNSLVQEWESLMDRFQQRLPFAAPNEKWVRMQSIFSLKEALNNVQSS